MPKLFRHLLRTLRPARLLAAAGLGALILCGARAAEPLTLTILHANDTHSFAAGVMRRGVAADSDEQSTGGYARLAAAVNAEKAKNPNVIALDAGDRWQGTLFFSLLGPDFITALTNRMPWDAMTLGNHEFDLGCERLAEVLPQEKLPILAANIARRHEGEDACPIEGRLPGTMVKTVSGVKVGIFGIANDEVKVVSKACPATTFDTREDAARKAVAALRAQGAEIIIALTHIGYPADRELARSVAGIDVIVGGHTHSLLGKNLRGSEGPYPTVEISPAGEPVLVVQAKRSTEYLGRLVVAFDEKGRAAAWTGAPVRLTSEKPRDPELRDAVAKAAGVLEKARTVKVSTNPNEFPDGLDPCRWGDCLAGMVTADAFLDFARPYGATIALLNGGAVRSALENGVADPDVGGPHLLQPSGLRYAVDPAQPVGHRILSVETVETDEADEAGKGAWVPLDPAKTYRIATVKYVADGGDDFAMFADAPRVPANDALEVDVMDAYLRAHDPLPMPAAGRITGMPEMPEAAE